MHHRALIPYADVHELSCGVGHHVDIDVDAQGHIGHFDGVVEERDAPVAIDHTLFPQTEHILGTSIGFRDHELAKQRIAFSSGPLEADVGDCNDPQKLDRCDS